ncbi:unnamed protein product [Urochloa humidicola]
MESDTERAPNPNSHPHQPLRLAKSTEFKRDKRRRRKDRKRQERLDDQLARWELGAPPPRPAATPSSPQPDIQWPCDPPPPPDLAEWSWGPPAVPAPQPTIVAATVPLHPQAAAVKSCRAFFKSQIEDEEEEDEGNAARFFGELLGGDAVLRGFYEAATTLRPPCSRRRRSPSPATRR